MSDYAFYVVFQELPEFMQVAVPGVLAHGNDLSDLILHRSGSNVSGFRVVAEFHAATVIEPDELLGGAVEPELDFINQP